MILWRCFRREGLSLSEWLEELDGETFHETIRQENDTMIETGLPQFTGETNLELKDTLTALGMPLAFDEEQADFSKMGYCRTEEIQHQQGTAQDPHRCGRAWNESRSGHGCGDVQGDGNG